MNSDGCANDFKVYFDYNATTPLANEVIENISKSLLNDWGNPSSSHDFGTRSKKSITQARAQIANMLNGQSSEIIFTSGGTETNNMIIYGIIKYYKTFKAVNGIESNEKPHVITSNVEHDSVILPIMELKKLSLIDCTVVEVNKNGVLEVETVVSNIRENTCFITVMAANNETGVVMPVAEIGERLEAINRERELKKLIRVLFHTDAAQIIGKEKIDVNELKVDYITVVGHKFYGPRIGCVWARGPIFPVFYGGGQETGIRPGTENTPMIVGLGTAAELVSLNIDKYREHMLSCRKYLERRIKITFGAGAIINCENMLRLPNTTNVSFVGDHLEGRLILAKCKRLIASVGAACHGGLCSQILINSGVPLCLARNAIRLSVGRDTTLEDVDNAVMDLAFAIDCLTK